MLIDNKRMTALYAAEDKVRYYNWCADLTLAGEDYKVNKILCFTKDETDPLADFIQVKKYDDGFLLILVYTQDEALLGECMDHVDTVKADHDDIEIRTPYPAILDTERIRGHYTLGMPEYPASPVYYIHSPKELLPRPEKDTVSVLPFRETDKAEITQAAAAGKLDPESMHADMFVPCTLFKDVRWYILRVNGEIAGYLRGECGYANIYDIGWLYVEPRFRGHGYAADLVMAFSKVLFAEGAIPHYGYAISEASARVAEKCGYVCNQTKPECRTLKPR